MGIADSYRNFEVNIFLSYFAGDRAFLARMTKAIKVTNCPAYPMHLKAFFGEKGLHDPDELDEHFRNEDLSIVLFSNKYVRDPWLRGEIHALLTLERKLRPDFVLPLFLKGLAETDIPVELSAKRFQVDFRNKTEEQGFSDLVDIITDIANRPRLSVFISHSSKDSKVAEALSDLLRSTFGLRSEEILCTSVGGYRLPLSSSVNDTLRRKIREAKVFVCIATENSIGTFQKPGSFYVAVELGARWGMRRHLAILTDGAAVDSLRAPINQLNALRFDDPSQVQQFIREIGPILGKKPESADRYQRAVGDLVAASKVTAVH